MRCELQRCEINSIKVLRTNKTIQKIVWIIFYAYKNIYE